MGLALFKDRRIGERRKLTGLMPGRLFLKESGEELTCRPVDVSTFGIGVLISKEIQPGDVLTLLVKSNKIEFQVAWMQPDFGKQDMFRYGLVSVNTDHNIEQLFVDHGCLR